MTDEQSKRLKKASAEMGVSVSCMVRRCIHLGLHKRFANLMFIDKYWNTKGDWNIQGDVPSDKITGGAP
jgi:hypothetical protein